MDSSNSHADRSTDVRAGVDRTCVECNTPFRMSAGEVGFYLELDLNLPKRCQLCRDARRLERQNY